MTNKKYSDKAVKISQHNFDYIMSVCKEVDEFQFQSFNTVLTKILESHDKPAYTAYLKGLSSVSV